MSDLIDREKAITAICEDGTWLEIQGCTEITMCERKQRDADILSELPTIDAVPVVRCKDCKYYNPVGVCIEMSSAVCEDSFCCWAEKKGD